MLEFETLVTSEPYYMFNSPPPDILRTAHTKPQLLIKKDNFYQICEACDLEYVDMVDIPKIDKIEFNFMSCLASLYLGNEDKHEVDRFNDIVS